MGDVSKSRWDCRLEISGDSLEIHELTRLLNVEPYYTHVKGEMNQRLSPEPYPASVWSYCVTGADLDAGIAEITKIIEPHQKAFMRFLAAQKLFARVCVIDFCLDLANSNTLDSASLGKLSALGLDLKIQLYVCADEAGDTSTSLPSLT